MLRREAEPAICEAAVELVREAAVACVPRGGKAYAYVVRDGDVAHAFDLGRWRPVIEAQLTGWGFPCEDFQPELDRELSDALTLDRLEVWSRESRSWRLRGGELFATARQAAVSHR